MTAALSRRWWRPAVTAPSTFQRLPEPGELIAAAHQPWRVVQIDPVDPSQWTEDEHAAWTQRRCPDPWKDAPVHVMCEPVPPNPWPHDRAGLRVDPFHYAWWFPLPEHFAVCVKCGQLSPCTGHAAEVEAVNAARHLDRILAIPAGACPACSEVISTRQKSITFPGPSVDNPFITDPAYHLRRSCIGAAQAYEERWIAADPTRLRSLLTVACAGRLVVHQDGAAECFGTLDSDCPTVYARHRSITACYLQSHGCGRGCTCSGHPGTRIANPARLDYRHEFASRYGRWQ